MCSIGTNFRFRKSSAEYYSTSEVLIWKINPHHFHFTVAFRCVYVRNNFFTKTRQITQPDTGPYKYTGQYVVTFIYVLFLAVHTSLTTAPDQCLRLLRAVFVLNFDLSIDSWLQRQSLCSNIKGTLIALQI